MARPDLVELVTTGSAAEAQKLAQRLNDAGIGAIANAEPVARSGAYVGKFPQTRYRSFVLVAEPDRERALAIIHAEHAPEGAATEAEIEADLAEHAQRDREGDDDRDGDGVHDDDEAAWQNRNPWERFHRFAEECWGWGLRPILIALAAAFVYVMFFA